MRTYDTNRLKEMHVVYGKKCRESKTNLGYAPVLFNLKIIGGENNTLVIKLKHGLDTIQTGRWSYNGLYHEDTYIVVPKELA